MSHGVDFGDDYRRQEKTGLPAYTSAMKKYDLYLRDVRAQIENACPDTLLKVNSVSWGPDGGGTVVIATQEEYVDRIKDLCPEHFIVSTLTPQEEKSLLEGQQSDDSDQRRAA